MDSKSMVSNVLLMSARALSFDKRVARAEEIW